MSLLRICLGIHDGNPFSESKIKQETTPSHPIFDVDNQDYAQNLLDEIGSEMSGSSGEPTLKHPPGPPPVIFPPVFIKTEPDDLFPLRSLSSRISPHRAYVNPTLIAAQDQTNPSLVTDGGSMSTAFTPAISKRLGPIATDDIDDGRPHKRQRLHLSSAADWVSETRSSLAPPTTALPSTLRVASEEQEVGHSHFALVLLTLIP